MYYSSGVAEDEDAMTGGERFARACLFGVGTCGFGAFLVGEMRPRDSNVVCSVSCGRSVVVLMFEVRGVPPKLGMLPRSWRVIAKSDRLVR
jgi:hypothetical protein